MSTPATDQPIPTTPPGLKRVLLWACVWFLLPFSLAAYLVSITQPSFFVGDTDGLMRQIDVTRVAARKVRSAALEHGQTAPAHPSQVALKEMDAVDKSLAELQQGIESGAHRVSWSLGIAALVVAFASMRFGVHLVGVLTEPPKAT